MGGGDEAASRTWDTVSRAAAGGGGDAITRIGISSCFAAGGGGDEAASRPWDALSRAAGGGGVVPAHGTMPNVDIQEPCTGASIPASAASRRESLQNALHSNR